MNQEVAGSIPGTSTILKVDWEWNGIQPREDNWVAK